MRSSTASSARLTALASLAPLTSFAALASFAALFGGCAAHGNQPSSTGVPDETACIETSGSGAPPRTVESPEQVNNEASWADARPEAIRDPESASAGASAAPLEAPSTRLPGGILPGIATEVPVRGDRSVRVVHGGPSTRRALVYLHGMCGNPEAMAGWSPLASHYGTLIVLRADVPCGNRPGFKWPQDVRSIQRRIDLALAAVANQRGGHLERSRLVLVGYSQGAHRAERLAEAYPDRYPHLILGGPPGTASPERLAHTQAVAILGGERENTDHMQAGSAALQAAGLRSRFFLLPGVGHGEYGPQGPQVLGEVLAWLLD